jgi:hypothetical protein
VSPTSADATFGRTEAWFISPNLLITFANSKDYYYFLNASLDYEFVSEGSNSTSTTPSHALSYDADIGIKGFWMWPIELGFEAGYHRTTWGQEVSGGYYHNTLADFRVGITLAYLLNL